MVWDGCSNVRRTARPLCLRRDLSSTRRELLAWSVLAAGSLTFTRRAVAQTRPARIVAAGGGVTEILYALGCGERIAGVDSLSLYPTEARAKPNVGFFTQLSAEGLLALRPDLVVAIGAAGPPDVLKQLADAGVRVEIIAEQHGETAVSARIGRIGALVGEDAKARTLVAEVEAGFRALSGLRAEIAAPKRVLVVVGAVAGKLMVAGRDTAGHAMIALSGNINAAAALSGLKPLSDEGAIGAAPDLVVMMQGRDSPAALKALLVTAPLSHLAAVQSGAVLPMDGLYLLSFGPRTPAAARDLLLAAHPALAGRAARLAAQTGG